MRIRHISIRNFRGIRNLDWAIPDHNIVCLIGCGDSSKSTILAALRRLFHPQWNLSFDDADFYECDPSKNIMLDAVLGNLTDDFRALEKYGYLFSGWDRENLVQTDDPGEGLEDALHIRLTVGSDLEPAWTVIKNGCDSGIPFKPNDRAKVGVSFIGSFSDRHLTWSRGSILSKLTETESISESLASATRAAKSALEERRAQDLTSFDAVAKSAEETARILGVKVANEYKAHLDTEVVNVRAAGLALHDGAMPIRRLGLGSKRMLTTGLQKQALTAPHITLFDEVESGLEPHRIARLMQHLKADKDGQYFLATHSPVVLRELTVADLHVVHRSNGHTEVVSTNKPAIADSIQGKIRSGAEAFLAPKIVVCEGATEVGFLRGLDDYWVGKQDKDSFAYRGVALFDANGGSKVRDIAECLNKLGYDVAVLVDSDPPEQFSEEDAEKLREAGIRVAMWEGESSIEECVFSDIHWEGVKRSFHVASEIWDDDVRLHNQIRMQYCQDDYITDIASWSDTPRLREAIGKAAKASGWFKRQSWARDWSAAIASHLFDATPKESDLFKKIAILRSWIDDEQAP